MKVCPVAIAVGCAKCPVFKVCPLTRVLGDQPAKSDAPVAKAAPSKIPRNTSARATAKTRKPAKPSPSRRK